VPFRAYIPKEEVIMYRKDQKAGGRLIYKVLIMRPSCTGRIRRLEVVSSTRYLS
jgi:hypothetical protein